MTQFRAREIVDVNRIEQNSKLSKYPTGHIAGHLFPTYLLSDPNGSHTHTSTHTHGRDTNLLSRPPQLSE
jgi:hypothetical protein